MFARQAAGTPLPAAAGAPGALSESLLPGEMEERARLRARPDFPWVARQAAVNLASAYRGNFLLTRLLNDRGRVVLALLMLDMHFEPSPGPGLTAGRLKAEAAALGVCSPGRVGAVLAASRLLGLVAPVPDADRRRRRLTVTDRMLAVHRDRWRVMLNALRMVLPEGEAGLNRLDDDAFVAAYVAELLRPFRAGWRMMHDIPSMAIFADRDGGLLVALALFATGGTGRPTPVAELARAYRVSRSHVVDILQNAMQEGLVRRVEGRERGGFLAEPALTDAMEAFVATVLVRQANAVRHAMAVTGG